MQWVKNKNGFTIVELLVVVVVIAILASISIVSYNGITARAMDTKIRSLTSTVGKILVIEEMDGVIPAAQGYWSNANGVDSVLTPKHLPVGFRDDIKSSNVSAHTRTFRYYRCGDGFVIYASLNNPSSSDISNFQSIRTQCGHTTTHAPDAPPMIYNYAQLFT